MSQRVCHIAPWQLVNICSLQVIRRCRPGNCHQINYSNYEYILTLVYMFLGYQIFVKWCFSLYEMRQRRYFTMRWHILQHHISSMTKMNFCACNCFCLCFQKQVRNCLLCQLKDGTGWCILSKKITENIWFEKLYKSIQHWTSPNHSLACYNILSQLTRIYFLNIWKHFFSILIFYFKFLSKSC